MVEVVCLIVDGISDVDICWVDVSVMGRVVKGFLPIVDNIFDDEIYSLGFIGFFHLTAKEEKLYH